ncbi:MAG: START-like domain-containing protein [Flavobacteriaceae bacterium]|nr:START-like domain-containing protein [Flavobacteriaceae bacterium]
MSDKIKFEIEFPIQASPKMLYQYFATPSGLSEWFADNVNSRGEMFTFIWDGAEEIAKMLTKKRDSKIRFRWEENEDDTYFEFRIQVDALTNDVSLMITDFADEDEVEDSKMFWENQISELKHTIGA